MKSPESVKVPERSGGNQKEMFFSAEVFFEERAFI